MDWKQAIIGWRYLAAQKRHQRHLRATPRHVTNSMSMEQQPVGKRFSCCAVESRFIGVATLEPCQSAAIPGPRCSGLFVLSI